MSVGEELLDIVDEEGLIIGQAPRRLCHGNPELLHRAVHVLVFRTTGDLLLQKRSLAKDIQPGKWDTSVGGHLDCGETYLDAAKREMAEELGLTGNPLTFLYTSKMRNGIESENIETYMTITDENVSPNHAEMSEIKFWSASEIEASLGRGYFTPNFEDEWQMFKDFSRKYQVKTSGKVALCAGDSLPNIFEELYEKR